jgi:hypothetical protein
LLLTAAAAAAYVVMCAVVATTQQQQQAQAHQPSQQLPSVAADCQMGLLSWGTEAAVELCACVVSPTQRYVCVDVL